MEVDELYDLPPDRFVAERGAIARALRGEKRRDDAAAVAALRKPSVAAWVVNQLVRTRGAEIRALCDAGDALRAAQAALLAGEGDGRALRGAGERERAAVDALVQAARGLLSADGHEPSEAVIERVGDTLHAAALDEEAREQVRHGRLERELRHAGIGLGIGESAVATPSSRTSKPGGRSATSGRDAGSAEESTRETASEAAARVEADRAEAERVAQARAEARAAHVAAQRDADVAAHALQTAEEDRARAERALRAADDVLAAAREAAPAAADRLERAHAALRDLS
ncbi:MAG TPA: hypothetical protein VGF63_14150 [Solirubrobacteraceae bacterium]|jgi:hypothetical protein